MGDWVKGSVVGPLKTLSGTQCWCKGFSKGGSPGQIGFCVRGQALGIGKFLSSSRTIYCDLVTNDEPRGHRGRKRGRDLLLRDKCPVDEWPPTAQVDVLDYGSCGNGNGLAPR